MMASVSATTTAEQLSTPHAIAETQTNAETEETELQQLRAEVQRLRQLAETHASVARVGDPSPDPGAPSSAPAGSPLHALLLLADTALPLGSFAYSSGLESYLAHHHQSASKHQAIDKHEATPNSAGRETPASSTLYSKEHLLVSFLRQSLSTCARASLPFVLAAYDDPQRLFELDDMFDATVSCLVARRQSAETGRALLGAWMRGLAFVTTSQVPNQSPNRDIQTILSALDTALKSPSASSSRKPENSDDPAAHHGHIAPLWGAVGLAAGVNRHDTAYVFLLNHVRGLLSAAVRAGMLGPFKQLAMLAAADTRSWIEDEVQSAERLIKTKGVEAAGQVVPLNDIWGGRHEVLYSRVFNS